MNYAGMLHLPCGMMEVMTKIEVENSINDIRQKLMLYMNGVTVENMRKRGVVYRLNYGVSLPDLKKLVGDYPKDHELSQGLWKQECRECKMMAALLQPADLFSPDLADLWLETIEYPDLADVCCMALFPFMRSASETVFRWMASDVEIVRYCGFMTMANLMHTGKVMEERYFMELKDQVTVALKEDAVLLKQAARTVKDVYERIYGEF